MLEERFNKWLEDEINLHYNVWIAGLEKSEQKAVWLSDDYFELATYDSGLDLEFGKVIREVILVINDMSNFYYIKDRENYKKFILVCQLLTDKQLIDWGTSIRGCWFDPDGEISKQELDELIKFIR